MGGGCASLTTAYELTRPIHRGRYEVTVYQMGWRLGGKGASGRGPAGRIEEHGLHLWMGFYENAFQIMRECYAELGKDPNRRMRDWRQAFSPAPNVAVTDPLGDGEWDFWVARFPASGGFPGDPDRKREPLTVQHYISQAARLVVELLRSAIAMEDPAPVGRSNGRAKPGHRGPERADSLEHLISRLLRSGEVVAATVVCQAADLLCQTIDRWVPGPGQAVLEPIFLITDAIASVARRRLQADLSARPDLRRIWQVVDMIIAIIRGSFSHRLAMDPNGFDAINDYEWREWLRLHGASEDSLESGFMRAVYGLVFAFEDGDPERPRFAAGVALRGAMRMFFNYRGALFWRMNGGMGDIVFAPLYEVLKRRGVRFEFFHKLRNVSLGSAHGGERFVDALTFDVQARVRGGGEYQPLVDVKGVPSWLSRPDYAQLTDGKRLEGQRILFESQWETRREGTRTLHVVDDFDFVVLGVSIGVLPIVAKELIAADGRWQDMIEHVKTVPTQAFQIWLRRDVRQLGWEHPAVNLSGFAEPFDTWADMRHLIPEEDWKRRVRSIAYFCNVLPDPGSPNGEGAHAFHHIQKETVKRNAIDFLDQQARVLWPEAVRRRGGFRWGLLATEPDDPHEETQDERRFETQYWTANVDPSDRYVLSLPGSLRYRISPLERCFDNLTIAGDWTASGLDSGCIESAVISGRLAAHALTLHPPLSEITGYDHP